MPSVAAAAPCSTRSGRASRVCCTGTVRCGSTRLAAESQAVAQAPLDVQARSVQQARSAPYHLRNRCIRLGIPASCFKTEPFCRQCDIDEEGCEYAFRPLELTGQSVATLATTGYDLGPFSASAAGGLHTSCPGFSQL